MLGIHVSVLGVFFLLVSLLYRNVADDDVSKVPRWLVVLIVCQFSGGIILLLAGAVMQIGGMVYG